MPKTNATVDFDAVPQGSRSSVVEVTEHLVKSFAQQELRAGDPLPSERRMVSMLGVTRSVLRESLKSLAVLGIVEIRQGSGTFISTETEGLLPSVVSWGLFLTSVEAQQLIEARLHLESSLVGLAAQRRTAHDLEAIEAELEGMEVAESIEEFARHDAAFHLAIARAARNVVLSSTLESIQVLLAAWSQRVLEYSDTRDWVAKQHVQIVTAIREGDSQAATEAMRAHIGAVTTKLADTATTN